MTFQRKIAHAHGTHNFALVDTRPPCEIIETRRVAYLSIYMLYYYLVFFGIWRCSPCVCIVMGSSTVHTKLDRGLGLKIIYNVLEVTLSSIVSRPRSLFWQFTNSRCRRRAAHSSPSVGHGVISVVIIIVFVPIIVLRFVVHELCSDFGYDDSALVFVKLQRCRVTVRTGWTRARWKCPSTSIINRIYLRSVIKIAQTYYYYNYYCRVAVVE